MSVLINKGNRVFAEPVDVTFSPKHILNMFVAGDVNGDGLPDVIVLDNGNPFEPTDVGRVVILIGNGAGGFADPVFLAAGKSPTHAAITDLDRDGHADLLVANNVSDDLSLFRGRGDGTFGEPETIPAGDGPAHVAAADLDGDGDPDLAVANASGNSVSIFLNDGAGRFTAGG
jgi:hypothetical protein